MDLDVILIQRRRRNTPSAASPTPEIAPPPAAPIIPPPHVPKKRGRKRKHPLPEPPAPPPPIKDVPRMSTPTINRTVAGTESDISALTENSEIDVDSSLRVEESKPIIRTSVVASTPGSMAEEIDIVEVASPSKSTVFF